MQQHTKLALADNGTSWPKQGVANTNFNLENRSMSDHGSSRRQVVPTGRHDGDKLIALAHGSTSSRKSSAATMILSTKSLLHSA
eukprot:4692750-Amphidinium_carterae.2